MSISTSANLGFARRTNSIPLNTAEFALAQRHYPIVFGLEDPPMPLAIVGLRKDENLFLDADGKWQANAYIPAYVRRYPFILVKGPREGQLTLCVDAASDIIVSGDANPLVKDGKPGEVVKRGLALSKAFQAEAEKTQEFCIALTHQKLLERRNAQVTLPNGKKIVLGPLRKIDAEKFSQLPPKQIAEWHRKGWTSHVHAHLFSIANWSALAIRMTRD